MIRAMHCLMRTLFITKHVSFVIRLIMFRPGVNTTLGAYVWDQSGIRIIGIMQVSVRLGAILIPEYLDSIPAILLPGAE